MKRNLISGTVLVLVLAAVLLYHFLTGAEAGGPCKTPEECKGSLWGKFGAQCYVEGGKQDGYCTAVCSGKEDCPPSWACESVEYIVNDVKKGVDRVCVRPAPTAGQPLAAPGQPAVPTAPAPAPAPVAPR